MSTQKSATRDELFNLIDADSVAEIAEDKFHAGNIKRRRLSERIAHFMPHAIGVVWLAAYILSSPFTVGFFGRITPDIIWTFGEQVFYLHWTVSNLSPITLEGFMLVLSAVIQYRKDKNNKGLILLTASLWVLSTMVNVIGGIDELITTPNLTYIDMSYILAAILAGILISTVTLFAGRLIIQLSTGDITMEIDSSKAWQGTVKYNALKRAFENAASQLTTPVRANKYALIMARRYSEVIEIVEDTVDAIGDTQIQGQTIGSRASLDGQTSIAEMGFSAMARGNISNILSNDYATDNSNMPVTTVDKIRKMSKANVIKWIEANPDTWQQWIIHKSMVANAKHIAMQISEDGTATGAKSVERAFKSADIEL